jgi:hypothetical protein
MRKIALLLLGIFLLASLALADGPMVTWKSKDLKLDKAVKAGTLVLPAGQYKVSHVMDGNEHILVMALQGKNGQTFRVPCKMEPLQNKATQDEQHYKYEGQQAILTGIVFRGDMYFHAF